MVFQMLSRSRDMIYRTIPAIGRLIVVYRTTSRLLHTYTVVGKATTQGRLEIIVDNGLRILLRGVS